MLGGSQEAFRELVVRYQKPIFSLIVRMVRDRELAEDLSQETFVKAYRALDSYDQSRKFSSWLFKIAHNATIDHLRRARFDTESLDTGGREDRGGQGGLAATLEDPRAQSPERVAASRNLGRDLELAIANLRPEYREVMHLRHRVGLSYQEIAEVTGLALGTVKTHLHRARKELAQEMIERGWGEEL